MSTSRILIVEHEHSTIKQLKEGLTQWGYHVIGVATSLQAAKQLYQQERPHLTLINLHLNGYGEGVKLAHFIREQKRTSSIIYLASDLNREEIKLIKPTLPAGFLMVPLRPDLLYANVEIALNRSTEVDSVIKLTSGDDNYLLSPSDILYLEADHIYVQVHTTAGQKILQRRSLTDLLEQLPAEQFVRTHRSFAVNIGQLSRWNKQYVYVHGKAVPLSRGRRKEVLAILVTTAESKQPLTRYNLSAK